MAFVTGVLLVLLVLVAVPLKYFAGTPGPVTIIGIAHGYLFILYLVAAVDFGIRMRWPWLKLGLVMLAGTVPFCSFFAEHVARRDYQARLSLTAPAADHPVR